MFRRFFREPPPPSRPPGLIIAEIKSEYAAFESVMKFMYYKVKREHGQWEADNWYQGVETSVLANAERAIQEIEEKDFYGAMLSLEQCICSLGDREFFRTQYFDVKYIVQRDRM